MYSRPMRTTVNLDADVAAAVDGLRRESDVGLSEAVNTLARRGLSASRPSYVYVPPAVSLGMTVDVTNIGEVLDLLDRD